MTRISSTMDHTPVDATPRKRLTLAERLTILARQDDLCAGCRETLIWTVIDGKSVYGPMIDEHIVPLWSGGSNDLSNRELRCVPCAKAKTRKEATERAKVMRIQAKLKPRDQWPKAAPIRSRGFQRRQWGEG